MKTAITYLLFLFIFPLLLPAQEFSMPDTAAVRKNQVKEVKIFYSRGEVKHILQKTYRYDREGRCVYEREGTAGYHYEYSFHPGERQAWHGVQRLEDGTFVQGWDNEYFATGELKHTKHYYSAADTLFPTSEFFYDKAGNRIEEISYRDRKETHHVYCRFNEKKECIWAKDSMPGQEVSERENGRLSYVTYLDAKHLPGETWIFSYDEKGRIAGTVYRLPGKEDVIYTVTYPDGDAPVLKRNGKNPSADDKREWMMKWSGMLPREREDDYGLPYADPVSRNTWRHNLTRDKHGNIVEDKLLKPERIQTEEPVFFTYEYEFYKGKQ